MSGQDYIGSKISLISLSDIRYVGTLHSINTNDSTVSLENVRSFGTEGRRGNSVDEVAASETVFDFVVFRGSDIKDLQVFEAPVKPAAPPPPPPSRTQGMVDPSMRQSLEGYPPPAMNPYMMPPYPPQAHQAMYWQNPMYPGQQPPMPPPTSQQQQQQQQPPPPPQQHQMPSATSLPAQSPAPSRQAPIPVLDGSLQEQSSAVQSTPTTEQVDQQEIDGAAVENLAKQVSELDVDTKEVNEALLSSQHQKNYRTGRQNNNNYHRQNNASTSTTNGARNQQNDKHQRISIPQSDFDFESSNAKFRKNDLLKELQKDGDDDDDKHVDNDEKQPHQQPQVEEEVIIPPNDEDFYNKSKSFFDNISCESKERQDQQDGSFDRRGKFQEERRLNLETFGQASVDQSRFRNFRGRGGYRGGYRGNRGGGGYYRGGNRNNNYNNSNNNRNNAYGHKVQQQVEYQQ
ncbi:Scd6-like Sm domain-domain-containing protein [Absidia repens]|uniref:Scd6-like Sm domain-domain-containing protein n=1 Tax=Absidia repens TaxID=90262 RepID=A0A1X2ILE5_9FUNG|nr:Scd6-like Sm domain-domain-containing protein [Absidia repens]